MSKRTELYQALLRARSIAWLHGMNDFEEKIEALRRELETELTISDYDELIKHAGIVQAKVAYDKKRDLLKNQLKGSQ